MSFNQSLLKLSDDQNKVMHSFSIALLLMLLMVIIHKVVILKMDSLINGWVLRKSGIKLMDLAIFLVIWSEKIRAEVLRSMLSLLD